MRPSSAAPTNPAPPFPLSLSLSPFLFFLFLLSSLLSSLPPPPLFTDAELLHLLYFSSSSSSVAPEQPRYHSNLRPSLDHLNRRGPSSPPLQLEPATPVAISFVLLLAQARSRRHHLPLSSPHYLVLALSHLRLRRRLASSLSQLVPRRPSSPSLVAPRFNHLALSPLYSRRRLRPSRRPPPLSSVTFLTPWPSVGPLIVASLQLARVAASRSDATTTRSRPVVPLGPTIPLRPLLQSHQSHRRRPVTTFALHLLTTREPIIPSLRRTAVLSRHRRLQFNRRRRPELSPDHPPPTARRPHLRHP